MSKDSVVGQATRDFTHPSDRSDPEAMTSNPFAWGIHPVETGTAWLWNQSQKTDEPDVQGAGAPPTKQAANQVALNDQLQQEVAMRQSRTGFSSSGSMLDSQPKTASTVLLGS